MPEARHARSLLGTGALAVGFSSVFFSIVLTQLAAVMGWLSLGFRRAGGAGEDEAAAPRRRGLWLPLLVFVVASAVSASLSEAPSEALHVVGKEILAIGFAVAGAGIARRGDARVVAEVVLIAAAGAACWAIYVTVVEFHGAIDGLYASRTQGRRGLSATSLAYLLALAFAVALGVLFSADRRARAVAGVSAILAVLGMLIGFTRASWLAAAIALTATLVSRRAIALLAALALAATAVLFVPSDSGVLGRAHAGLDPRTQADRFIRYRIGAAIIRDHPLLGTGPGVLSLVQPRYALPESTDNSHLHNAPLQFLAERGPIGLAAWLWLMLGGLLRATAIARRSGGDERVLAAGTALVLTSILIIGLFNYVWDDWRLRALNLGFLGLVWSPALTAGLRGAIGASAREELA